VGLRRAAEIALDEGELLALRLSGQAVSLLRQARTWFRSVNDHAGAVLASTCCALCLARLDKRDPLQGEISTLGEEFEKMRKSSASLSSNLPAWIALLTIARQLDPPSLSALSPREYGTHLADGSPLPAELDGWLAPRVEARRGPGRVARGLEDPAVIV
jgi:hypothetical protein